MRRENKTAAQYGEVVARVSQEVYRAKNAKLDQAALRRAEMMEYRDERRNGGMKPKDWVRIEKGLAPAYGLLLAGLRP